MKKVMPVVLILLIAGISVFNYFTSKNNKISITEISLQEENKEVIIEKSFEEGNMENSGGASTVYVENIELINNYLDLDMMLKYKDLITSYGLLLPSVITSDISQFYNENADMISKTFGIYSSSDFDDFYKLLDGLEKKDILSGIKINQILQEGNLLKAEVNYIYGEKNVSLPHYINYVFINGEPQIFIYN
ncbi:hypothetical protein NE686_17210 [Tissierella carlieri]|uniref:Uncharacterized protein n=1 Tax=Tissierella carlieri TaxID=689904 RepID=A0ABT1SED3_9FIRM|nr:hypothetical protein [Tissierella carlieri]MCQ4924844.1 hypothetical protein [Tissierella carlieri]